MSQSLDKIGNLSLRNITLPGTHDSGTYFLMDRIMPDSDSGFIKDIHLIANQTNYDFYQLMHNWSQS